MFYYYFKFFYNFFFRICKKFFKDLSAKYYQDNKERLRKWLVKDISLSKEEKEEKRKYGHEQYKNLPEDKKLRQVEHRK